MANGSFLCSRRRPRAYPSAAAPLLARRNGARYNAGMRHRRTLLVVMLVVAAFASAGCRGVQIRNLEEKVDKLENRVVALETKVEMLTK